MKRKLEEMENISTSDLQETILLRSSNRSNSPSVLGETINSETDERENPRTVLSLLVRNKNLRTKKPERFSTSGNFSTAPLPEPATKKVSFLLSEYQDGLPSRTSLSKPREVIAPNKVSFSTPEKQQHPLHSTHPPLRPQLAFPRFVRFSEQEVQEQTQISLAPRTTSPARKVKINLNIMPKLIPIQSIPEEDIDNSSLPSIRDLTEEELELNQLGRVSSCSESRSTISMSGMFDDPEHLPDAPEVKLFNEYISRYGCPLDSQYASCKVSAVTAL
jgi:hypothetical protein